MSTGHFDHASQGSDAALTGPGDRLRQVRRGTSSSLQLLISQLTFTVGVLVFFMLVDSLLMMMAGG